MVPAGQEQHGMETPPPPAIKPLPLLLAGGAVGIKEVGAGLSQVPVEHLQHPVALHTRLQPQAEELLHLQGERASEGDDRGATRLAGAKVGGQGCVVPSGTGWPAGRSSRGSAGLPGTPRWSHRAPCPAPGGACGQCLPPPLGRVEPVAGVRGHRGCPQPWPCSWGALSAWSWDHPQPWDLQPLLGLCADSWPPQTQPREPKRTAVTVTFLHPSRRPWVG